MRLRFLVASLVALVLFAGAGYAQTFTGTVDGYWSYNSNTPNAGAGFRPNNYRAFDTNDQTFDLNYGELAIDYKPNNVGVRVDIGFGNAADVVYGSSFADNESLRHIQQAYITATHNKLTADFGKFVTPIGAEVVETKDNWNYSRGLLFTFAIPFTHFGARTTYVVNDKVTLAGYVVNGWNSVNDNNASKSVGFTATYKPIKKLTVVANGLFGKETTPGSTLTTLPLGSGTRQLWDGIVTYEYNDKVSLMVNYDYGVDRGLDKAPGVSSGRKYWQGFATYLKAKVSDQMTLASRYEWLDDHHGFMTGSSQGQVLLGTGTPTPQKLQSYTATASFPWEGLVVWAEFRTDWSTNATFNKTRSGAQSLVDHQYTTTLGITYAFTKMVK